MITLESVTEGMKVFDSENHRIGKVDYVKLVETDPATGQPLTADIEEHDDQPDSLDREPRRGLLDRRSSGSHPAASAHEGFVRMDADGIFSADRYILPEQISSVAGDRIVLNVSKSELQKAH